MPDHLTASSVEDLLGGCVNIQDGYPGAAEYTGDGPHTIAIFAKSLVSDASLTGTGGQPYYELENSRTPARTSRSSVWAGIPPRCRGCPGLFEGGTKVFAKAQPAELDELFTPIATGQARPPR